MLTKNDLKDIGKVIDQSLNQKFTGFNGKNIEEITTDIAAIQVRLADLETSQVTKLDMLELRSLMRSVEKRVTAIEGKLTKFVTKDDLKSLVTKDDLKKEFRGVVKRKDLLALEKRLINKINSVVSSFDHEILDSKDRIERLEHHLVHPPIASA